MVQLKTLFLHNNLLVEIPTSLCQLNQLVEFSLDWLIYIEPESAVFSAEQKQELSKHNTLKKPLDPLMQSERLTLPNAKDEITSNFHELTRRSAERTNEAPETRKTTQVGGNANRTSNTAP